VRTSRKKKSTYTKTAYLVVERGRTHDGWPGTTEGMDLQRHAHTYIHGASQKIPRRIPLHGPTPLGMTSPLDRPPQAALQTFLSRTAKEFFKAPRSRKKQNYLGSSARAGPIGRRFLTGQLGGWHFVYFPDNEPELSRAIYWNMAFPHLPKQVPAEIPMRWRDALGRFFSSFLPRRHEQKIGSTKLRLWRRQLPSGSLYSADSAGIAALYGPLHGGGRPNEEVPAHAEGNRLHPERFRELHSRARPRAGRRSKSWGFGHRVYKAITIRRGAHHQRYCLRSIYEYDGVKNPASRLFLFGLASFPAVLLLLSFFPYRAFALEWPSACDLEDEYFC